MKNIQLNLKWRSDTNYGYLSDLFRHRDIMNRLLVDKLVLIYGCLRNNIRQTK